MMPAVHEVEPLRAVGIGALVRRVVGLAGCMRSEPFCPVERRKRRERVADLPLRPGDHVAAHDSRAGPDGSELFGRVIRIGQGGRERSGERGEPRAGPRLGDRDRRRVRR